MVQSLNLYAQMNPFSLFDQERSLATHFVDFYLGGARIMDDPTVGFGLYIWGIPTLICLVAAL